MKNSLSMKKLSINNFITKLLSTFNRMCPVWRSLRSLLRSLVVKSLIDNIFIKRLGLRFCFIEIYHCKTLLKGPWKKFGLISQRNLPIKCLWSTMHNFDPAHFGIHLQGYRNRYIGILPNATFGNWKKVILAKNCIRKMTALTKLIVHKNCIRKIFSNGFEKP